MYGYWVLADFAFIITFDSEFVDSVYNFAMGCEHYYDFDVEKLLDSEIDFL